MAPRGRPRKKNTRMDAALDHLKPMGFTSRMIQSAVKELLKVYGDEGWLFIEEDSYRVLIEELIKEEPQERNEGVVIFEEDLKESTSDHHGALPADTAIKTMLLPCGSGDTEIGAKLQPCGSGIWDRTGGHQTGVCKPCHGWIDDYDDGDERRVKPVPGTFAQEVERLLLGRIRQRGRKKRQCLHVRRMSYGPVIQNWP